MLIPTGVADAKIALKSWGSVYDLVFKLNTGTGEPMKAPLISDVVNGFVLNSVAITTTDATVAGPTISVDDIRSNPILLDNSLLQDSSFDLVKFVEAPATQSRYARYAASAITLGNTSNVGALSAITASGVTAATTLVTGVPRTWLNLFCPARSGVPEIGAAFLMSNTTLATRGPDDQGFQRSSDLHELQRRRWHQWLRWNDLPDSP